MFVKLTKSKNYQYLQIVESYRQDGKSRHKTIASLGRLDLLLQDDQLKKIAHRLLEISGEDKPFSIEDLTEIKRLKYGHIVYEKIFKSLKIGNILQTIDQESKSKFDLADNIFYLIINRLLTPSSKKKAFELKDDFKQIAKPKNLQHIYRSLDKLGDNKDRIESDLYLAQNDLFKMSLSVVFYDVTTFHFESVKNDKLRDFGFSKAGKFNEVQVVMGLLVNQKGQPIGFDLFPGNTFEGGTLVKALEKLKQRFQISKVIVVADKGMNSKSNLHLIKQAGFDYIVSSRIKTASKSIKDQIFDLESYEHTTDPKTGEVLMSYKKLENTIKYKDTDKVNHEWKDNIVISWSSKRAQLDAKKRKRMIQRAESMVDNKTANVTRKNGAARYLKVDQDAKASEIDNEKIKNDSKWDGYYAVQYSGKELTHNQIMENYHQLWKIEESFRVMKTTMDTRPIFHWTPKRITGHFVMCFLAFAMERKLELRLSNNNINLSPQKIKEALLSLQVSEVEHNEKRFYLKGKHSKDAGKIMRAMKIAPIKNLTTV